MKKVILTKNRLKALNTALSIDDVLFEKFKRMNEELDKKVQKFYKNPKKYFRIFKNKGKYFEAVQIKKVQVYSDTETIIII